MAAPHFGRRPRRSPSPQQPFTEHYQPYNDQGSIQAAMVPFYDALGAGTILSNGISTDDLNSNDADVGYMTQDIASWPINSPTHPMFAHSQNTHASEPLTESGSLGFMCDSSTDSHLRFGTSPTNTFSPELMTPPTGQAMLGSRNACIQEGPIVRLPERTDLIPEHFINYAHPTAATSPSNTFNLFRSSSLPSSYSSPLSVLSLQAHQPFLCRWCPRDFPRGCELRMHEKTHTKPYPCRHPFCHKTFASSRDATRHERTHQPWKQHFSCGFPGCDSVHSRMDSCLRHLKEKHVRGHGLPPVADAYVVVDDVGVLPDAAGGVATDTSTGWWERAALETLAAAPIVSRSRGRPAGLKCRNPKRS